MAAAAAGEMLGTVDDGTGKGSVFRVQLAAGSIGYDRGLWRGQDKVGVGSREVGEHKRNLPEQRTPRELSRDSTKGWFEEA